MAMAEARLASVFTPKVRTTLADMQRLLTCPSCKNLLNSPVLMPCAHTYCMSCAEVVVNANRGCKLCSHPVMLDDLKPALVQGNSLIHIRKLLELLAVVDSGQYVEDSDVPRPAGALMPQYSGTSASSDVSVSHRERDGGDMPAIGVVDAVMRDGTEEEDAQPAAADTLMPSEDTLGVQATLSDLKNSVYAPASGPPPSATSIATTEVDRSSSTLQPAPVATISTSPQSAFTALQHTPAAAVAAASSASSWRAAGSPPHALPSGAVRPAVVSVPAAATVYDDEMSDEAAPPRSVAMVGTGLSDEERATLERMARIPGVEILSTFSTAAVTHVVTPLATVVDGNRLCKRTLKYMMGILSGAWIVGMDWVDACIAANGIVPEAPFQIHGDMKTHGGPMAGRRRATEQEHRLLTGLKVYVIEPLDRMTRSDMCSLLTIGGATVLDHEAAVEAATGPVFIVMALSKDSSRRAQAVMAKYPVCVAILQQGWVLDSVGKHEIVPHLEAALAPYRGAIDTARANARRV